MSTIHALDDWPDDPTEGTLDELAARYATARCLIKELGDAAAALELELAARMEGDRVETGVGVLFRNFDRRSTWRDTDSPVQMRADVRESVASTIARNIVTGEINQDTVNVARAAIDLMHEVVPAYSSLKSAGARRVGLRVGDYRQFSEVTKVTFAGPEQLGDDHD